MEELAVHEAAQLFPLMTKADLDALARDIKANGLREPIVLYQNKILDGRGRYAACLATSTEPRFRKAKLNGGFSPYQLVIENNIETRDLSVPQRAAIAVEILPMLTERAKERKRYLLQGGDPEAMPEDLGEQGQALAQAAKLMEIGQSTVDRARLLVTKRPDLLARMKAGEFPTLAHVRRATGLTHRDDHKGGKVVQYGRGDKWTVAIKPLRLYLNAWQKKGFEFKHINPTEARKRLKEVHAMQEQLAAVEADLEERAVKATFTVPRLNPRERE